ncbi:hypothetical protein GX586_08755 [bacterium]|nr:hypothetical protein [bacterium]
MTHADDLLIGWAARDITPDRPVNIFGQFRTRISKGVHDPVTATALSMTSGGDSVIWVSCDLCLVPMAVLEQCREKLLRRLPHFPAGKLIMSATHTHCAPAPDDFWYPPVPEGVMTPAEYCAFLSDRIAEAVEESWNARKPGAVGWGHGYAVVGHNRRAVYFDDLSRRPGHVPLPGVRTEKTARMYGNTNDPRFDCIEGYVDHSVNMLFTFDHDKRLTGAVINLPCPAQETEHMEEISADFWHDARAEIRKRHGGHVFLLPQCAPSGDLSPHLMYNKKAEQRMLTLKNRTSRQEIACRIASAFDDTLGWAQKDIRRTAALKHVARTIALDRRLISDDEYRDAQADLAALGKAGAASAGEAQPPWGEQESVLFARKSRCTRIIERYEEQKTARALPVHLHVVRLGEIVFATSPFELFLDFGLRIVARSPAVQTFLVQLAADNHFSYLATRKAEQGESYSACLYSNEIGSAGGQQLVEETVKTIDELWAD